MKFENFINSLVERETIPGISILIGKGSEIFLKKHYSYKSLKPEKQKLKEFKKKLHGTVIRVFGTPQVHDRPAESAIQHTSRKHR